MPGRGDEAARADAEEIEHQVLVERLRRLQWPKPEPGQAERAFERFKSETEDED